MEKASASRPAPVKPDPLEDEDVEMAEEPEPEPEPEVEEEKPKPKPRKKKEKKVIPVGRNGLKKKRVMKSRMTVDAKGYMGTFAVRDIIRGDLSYIHIRSAQSRRTTRRTNLLTRKRPKRSHQRREEARRQPLLPLRLRRRDLLAMMLRRLVTKHQRRASRSPARPALQKPRSPQRAKRGRRVVSKTSSGSPRSSRDHLGFVPRLALLVAWEICMWRNT